VKKYQNGSAKYKNAKPDTFDKKRVRKWGSFKLPINEIKQEPARRK